MDQGGMVRLCLLTYCTLSTEVWSSRWKLHLRPKNMASSHITDQDIPMLPPNRTAIEILGNFMGYLFQCTKTYIQKTHASGCNM